MKKFEKEINEIVEWLTTDFERQLFINSLKKLTYVEDPTRYNSFAHTFREFFRILLSDLAPDQEVRLCGWFKVSDESKPNMITRAQRIQYIICKGLSEEFVKNDLEFNFDNAKRQTLKPIEILNKYVHLDESSFKIDPNIGDEVVEKCITSLYNFIDQGNKFNHTLMNVYENRLYNIILEIFIEETFNELDNLSTHSRVEDVSLEKLDIVKINSTEVQIAIYGSVEVELQYGSDRENKYHENTYFDTYPFDTIEMIIPVATPFAIYIDPEDIKVDTSSFYE